MDGASYLACDVTFTPRQVLPAFPIDTLKRTVNLMGRLG